jgi:hypothetical protein
MATRAEPGRIPFGPPRSLRQVEGRGARRIRLVAYGARLESVLGASPRVGPHAPVPTRCAATWRPCRGESNPQAEPHRGRAPIAATPGTRLLPGE